MENKTKRVAYVLESFPVQSETFVINEISGLLKRGVEVGIAARIWNEKILLSESLENVLNNSTLCKSKCLYISIRVIYLAFKYGGIRRFGKKPKGLINKIRSILSIADLVIRLKKFKPDVIVTHFGFDNAVSSVIYASIYEIKNIIYLHGSDVHTVPHRSLNWICNNSDVITNSKYMQGILESQHVSNITVSPPGVDSNCFLNSRSARKYLKPLIVSVARLGHAKDHRFMLNVFSQVKLMFPTSELWLIGDGPDKEELIDTVCKLDLKDVRFLGFVSHDEVPKIVGQAWIFALFSKKEALGQVFIEAQASGLPCISNVTGGIPEIITHGKNGFLIAERDSAGLDEAVHYFSVLLSDKKMLQEFSRHAIENFESRFTIEKHLDFMCEKVLS